MEIAAYLAGGLVLLVAGGELLVRGSVAIAERMGVSSLLIGLTLVGFGTSMPELVTSVIASLEGAPGIAVGNIVGSNIANILLILGVSALIYPIAVQGNALRRDGMIVVATAALFAALGLTVDLERWVGVVFVALLVAYMIYAFRQERVSDTDHTAAYEKGEAFEELIPHAHGGAAATRSAGAEIALSLVMAVGGIALVVGGGMLLVDGAVALARVVGMSEAVIGLTVVAVGTSLPELVTSVVAAVRRHADVALGNVLGSNIYNVLGIGGVTALIAPTDMPADIAMRDNFIMLAVSVLLVVLALTRMRISRAEGGILLGAYVAYIAFLWP